MSDALLPWDVKVSHEDPPVVRVQPLAAFPVMTPPLAATDRLCVGDTADGALPDTLKSRFGLNTRLAVRLMEL